MSDKYKLLQDNLQVCKRLFGVKLELLETIIVKVQNQNDVFLLENSPSNPVLDREFSISNQLLLTLKYLRQYATFLSLGFSYGISESYAYKIFHKIKVVLADIIGLKNPDKLRYTDVKTVIK